VRDKMITRENYAISVPESSALGARIDVAMVDELCSPWRREVVQRHLGGE
jgi:hypothetical protein